MLIDSPGGLTVGELQDCLEDPMSDPQVRQDETTRPATVEHVKQLRDRIEKTNFANLEMVEKRLYARLVDLFREAGRRVDEGKQR